MADVKFMDLSQNDNPATTDSVLIGNSTDGLKRTSVGAIGNLFSVTGLFHFETITGQTTGSNVPAPIIAPDVPGYNFAFWLPPVGDGNSYYAHIYDNISKQDSVWMNFPDGDTLPKGFRIIAVYVNSKMA